MSTPKKKTKPVNFEATVREVEGKMLGIALTAEARKIFEEAFALFPTFTRFSSGEMIYRDTPTKSEFARIMLITQCKKFIEQNKKGVQ